jgi:hypothetical protein
MNPLPQHSHAFAVYDSDLEDPAIPALGEIVGDEIVDIARLEIVEVKGAVYWNLNRSRILWSRILRCRTRRDRILRTKVRAVLIRRTFISTALFGTSQYRLLFTDSKALLLILIRLYLPRSLQAYLGQNRTDDLEKYASRRNGGDHG